MIFCKAYTTGTNFKIGKYKRFLAESGNPPVDCMEVTYRDGNEIGVVPNNELTKIL